MTRPAAREARGARLRWWLMTLAIAVGVVLAAAVQGFEPDVPLVLLVTPGSGPADAPDITYEDMLAPSGLVDLSGYVDAIGADFRLLFDTDGEPTGLVEVAHVAGLQVHAWTLRKENAYLPPALRIGSAEGATGDVRGMMDILSASGIDGVFTDDPALVVSALGR